MTTPESVTEFSIFTARYSNKTIVSSGLLPVRITLGYPRFKLAYKPVTYAALAPRRAYFGNPYDEFRRQYRQDLSALTVERIVRDLGDLAREHGRGGVVALCFEDIREPRKEGLFCHRELLAEFLIESGFKCNELTEPTA